MRGLRRLIGGFAALLLAGCFGDTPERARISQARPLATPGGWVLEVEQDLRFSHTMLDALASGIPLRLSYRYAGCAAREWQSGRVLELRYAPVRRVWELDGGAGQVRRFSRRSSLLAALDRVRLPLPLTPPAGCAGDVQLALDLTTLPTPLRFPAFLRPAEWRMVSPTAPWQRPG